jgi:hypothetical protein
MHVSKLFALFALCAIVSLTAHGQSTISHLRTADGKFVEVRRTKGKVGLAAKPTPVPTPRPTPRPTPTPSPVPKSTPTPTPRPLLRQGFAAVPQIEGLQDLTLEKEREARLKRAREARGLGGSPPGPGSDLPPIRQDAVIGEGRVQKAITPTPTPTPKPQAPKQKYWVANVTGVMLPLGTKGPLWLSDPDSEGKIRVSSTAIDEPLLIWKGVNNYHLRQWDWLLEGADDENLRVLIVYGGRLYYCMLPAGSNMVGLEEGMVQYQLPKGKLIHWGGTGRKQAWLQPDKDGLFTIVAREGMVVVRIVRHGYKK